MYATALLLRIPILIGFIVSNSGTEAFLPPPTFGPRTSKRSIDLHLGAQHQDEIHKATHSSLRSAIAGAIFSATFMVSPAIDSVQNVYFHALAAEEVTVANSKTSLLTSPTPVGSEQSETVVDEVWTLIYKYFMDRTFNGQNWGDVKEKYTREDGLNGSGDKSQQLAVEMTKSLGDKYSRMLDTKAYQAIQKYDLIGVGVTLMPNAQKQIVVGSPPIAGSASAQAGMDVGDFVLAINGISTNGRTAFDIIDQISENPNAKTITMTVRTEGKNDLSGEGFTREVTLDRKFEEVRNPISYKVAENRKDGTKVGYVRITEFNSIVKAKLEEALTALEAQQVNAYVLDLRSNPGGAFQSAVEISSLFIDDQVATYVIDSNQVELPFRTAKGRRLVDAEDPIAIWIDGGSASASEVLTGSLHDNCRAIVMGEKSFGKGLVQAVYGLKNGAGLVLTVAKYVTPGGNDIQGRGIIPDIPSQLPSVFLPILSSDTSTVDFADISSRLNMCQLPTSH